MADHDDHDARGGPRLRVDRLAAAMDAARARARAAADQPARVPGPSPVGADGDARTTPRRGPGGDPDMPDAADPSSPDASDPSRMAAHRADADAPGSGPDPSAPVAATIPPGPLLLTAEFRADPWPDAPEPGAQPGPEPAMPVDTTTMTVPPAHPVPPVPPGHPANGPALLSLSGVATDIGRYRILHDMTFDVPKGGVTMLLGRNGAGKTTTLRTVIGLWRARAGSIGLAGDRIDRWPTHRIARAGVGYVPESMSIFGDLTVAENIALGARSGPVSRDRLDWLTGLFPPLATFWRAPAGNLSGGQKQMLALARAFVERRRLYLIDEPTKGLAPAIVATVVAALRDLKLQGATILMVEQNFAVACALGDTCVVVDDGRVTWRGAMADLARDPALQTRLLGLDLGDAA